MRNNNIHLKIYILKNTGNNLNLKDLITTDHSTPIRFIGYSIESDLKRLLFARASIKGPCPLRGGFRPTLTKSYNLYTIL